MLLESIHNTQHHRTGEMKPTSCPCSSIPKAGILPRICFSPRLPYSPALSYLHQQQTQWYILLLLHSSQQQLAWAVNMLSFLGQSSSLSPTVASHDRRWIYYMVFSKTDSRSSLQDSAVPHRHEGLVCAWCCLIGRHPDLEPYSYHQVYIPWPFNVSSFTPTGPASVIIFSWDNFWVFSISFKEIPASTTGPVSHCCLHSPLPSTYFTTFWLTEPGICLRNSVRHTQLVFTAPSHLIPL